jgi:hypothetical protein
MYVEPQTSSTVAKTIIMVSGFQLNQLPNLFNYWSEVWGDTFGVDPKLNTMVEDSGWYFEWYDPGTMMVWEN